MKIVKAEKGHVGGILRLLSEVLKVHNSIRPDIFRKEAVKYGKDELISLISNEECHIFVAEGSGGRVFGYVISFAIETKGDSILRDVRTLYIDDLCVDEGLRGKGIGTALFEHAKSFAKSNGFDEITLNVWKGNSSAEKFYEKCGMKPRKTLMELKLGHDEER